MKISRPILIQGDELNSKMRSLNKNQREIFDIINDWARKSFKNVSLLAPNLLDSIYIFQIWNAGYGKSFSMKFLYHSLTKMFFIKKFKFGKKETFYYWHQQVL